MEDGLRIGFHTAAETHGRGRMRKAVLALVLSCLGSLVFPQKPFPRLISEVGDKSEALPVTDVDVEARIVRGVRASIFSFQILA